MSQMPGSDEPATVEQAIHAMCEEIWHQMMLKEPGRTGEAYRASDLAREYVHLVIDAERVRIARLLRDAGAVRPLKCPHGCPGHEHWGPARELLTP